MSLIALAIDTSTEACSVGLQNESEVTCRYTEEPRKHSEMVLPAIDELLSASGIQKQQLDYICFSRGPGSFTGLRIAASIVQGLSFALDKPVIAVSSLQVLAQRCHREYGVSAVHAAIDARMGEVYWGSYCLDGQGIMQLAGREMVIDPARVADTIGEEGALQAKVGAGTGWQYHNEINVAVEKSYAELFPHARDLLECARYWRAQGECLKPEEAIPVYLRDNVAQKSAK